MKSENDKGLEQLQLEHIGRQEDFPSQIASKLKSKVSIESCQMRIPEDQIIIKEPGQKALVSSIICPICLVTLPMPYYECEQCNNSFCPNCIENWWGKHGKNSIKTCIFNCQDPTFKKVKRSNTYLALLDALQFKCNLCSQVLPLSSYEKHKLKECPQNQTQCQNINCSKVLKLRDLSQHEKTCEYRPESCKYCRKQFAYIELTEHQEKNCLQKTIKCGHKRCDQMVKVIDYEKHTNNCQFREVNCPWCEESYLQTQFSDHQLKCEKKLFQCEWCNETFKLQLFQQHQCSLAKQICKLCEISILSAQIKQHKAECMFEHMVQIKHQNKLLTEENAKLHFKVLELQQLIEDTISNSEGKALEVMRKFKMKERKELERDLMRIEYSMASVNKLKEEETAAHMNKSKFLILGHGLCIQCKLLENRFAEMLEPLIANRKEVLQKIFQFDKLNETERG